MTAYVVEEFLDPDDAEDEDDGTVRVYYGLGEPGALRVHLLSADESAEHAELRALEGRRVRVTVEALDG